MLICTIHHLAGSGGTIICKCLASIKGVVLLSEVNPLNKFATNFTPSAPFAEFASRYGSHISQEDMIKSFNSQLDVIVSICRKQQLNLILRDHTYYDFFSENDVQPKASLRKEVSKKYDVISAITIRHPLDNYMSHKLQSRQYGDYVETLDEYCLRYLTFLDYYPGVMKFKYEDFCLDPAKTMVRICDHYGLAFCNEDNKNFKQSKLSGDSGRTNLKTIEKPSSRVISAELDAESRESYNYKKLLSILDYKR